MKKTISLVAMAATLCAVACKKDVGNDIEVPAGEPCEVTIGIENLGTKSTEIEEENEVKVNSLQIFVFRGNVLDAYKKVTNASAATVSCTSGDREIYALVNGADKASIVTKTDLLACTSNLSSHVAAKEFVMIGSVTKTLPQVDKITIPVDRLSARVVVKKITRNFTAAAYQDKDFQIQEIYLSNAPGDINLGKTSAPSVWYSKLGVIDNDIHLLTEKNLEVDVDNGNSHSIVHNFYCYPNGTEADVQGGEWSARHTRLVIKVKLGTSDYYYYPITLPKLQANHSYEIEELKITRPGSDSPDAPVSFQDCQFEIKVNPWQVVAVTEGTTI